MCPHKKFNELAAQQAHQADPLRLVAALPRSRAAYAQIVGWRGAAERPWTLPGEARVEVSQLYPSRVQSAGPSSSGAAKAPAVVGRRPTSLQGRRGFAVGQQRGNTGEQVCSRR